MDITSATTATAVSASTAATGGADAVTGDAESEALRAIEAVVATVERTQRAKDAEGFIELFRPDALWTTAHGKVLIGLDAIAEFTRAVLPQSSWDGDVTYRVAHVQFLRPDVAAVKVRQVYHEATGDTEGAPLYVMTKEEDGWLLHVGQNTLVVA
ncbi:SgcJ/EcaC family oxidoreductase [Streptomyces sp. HSW2009]|uniref:SgcJ/EcaC family oxidoreductase n=1 Tax=Streptomyces sp. HSW2009 TaxID=3142890 RepID=UPI0032EB6A16